MNNLIPLENASHSTGKIYPKRQVDEPIILHIETATDICSVALSKGKQLLGLKEEANGYSHAENLILFIQELISSCDMTPENLDAVCLSAGPGSYTGLRIGAATAKGLCYTSDIPLIAVPTLESIAAGAQNRHKEDNLYYAPMIDARRMEVYTALFDEKGNMIHDISAQVIDADSFQNLLQQRRILFCGNGAPKCESLLATSPNALFDYTPLSAKFMIERACAKFELQQFEDIAYFEPFYLKEYIPGKATVKGLY
jgi:tRNA threonylcarbamoyladenosine biosynthesis protein TsaB